MNLELLRQLYAIHSPSYGEKKMRKFLKRKITECGATFVQDVHGNLLVTKGLSDTYPCVASHIDQVQKSHSKDFECVFGNDVIFGYSARAHAQQGLGADDKNGIFICLECLRKYDVLKCAFFVGEEVGCIGSSAVDLSFFSDCRFIIEPDRRGSSDLITNMFCGYVCSDEFIRAIGAERFGYKEVQGSITDVGELVERGVGISCLNLSCGYYEAHSDQEFTIPSELENCLNFVQTIIEECTDVYPFNYSRPNYNNVYRISHAYGGRCDYYDWYDDYSSVGSDDDGWYESDEDRLYKRAESALENGIIGDIDSFAEWAARDQSYYGLPDDFYDELQEYLGFYDENEPTLVFDETED